MRIVEDDKNDGDLAVTLKMTREEWAEVVASVEEDGQYRSDDAEVDSVVCRVVLELVRDDPPDDAGSPS